MRPKRQKPSLQKPGSQRSGSQHSSPEQASPEQASPEQSGSEQAGPEQNGSERAGSEKYGYQKAGLQKRARAGFSSRRSIGRPFERQVDADLTDPESSDNDDPVSTEFSGADFPEVGSDSGSGSGNPSEAPVITHAVVRERAVRLLVNREHGRHELERKLLQRELPPDLIDSVLEQLAEEGLQCDARFAESYTRMRVDRGYGANKVRADLQTRRLEQSVIEDAITDSGTDWNSVAGTALAKKFGGRAFVDVKTRAKMQRYLYQRGFAVEEIRSAIDDCEAADSEI